MPANSQNVVVVVLANLMDRDGTLNEETRGRLELGCETARVRGAAEVMFMGWAYREDSDLPISEAMESEAIRRGLCEGTRMLCNRLSRDTVGDGVFSALSYAADKVSPDLIVVTSDYHVPRVREIFEFVWGRQVEVFGAVTPVSEDKSMTEAQSCEAFRRTFQGVKRGDLAACTKRLLSEHPFYNGKAMPGRPFKTDEVMRQLAALRPA